MANKELSSHHPEINKPQEACGITAIFSKTGKNIAQISPPLQEKIQHRGYDTAGIALWNDGELLVHVGEGKVMDVFPPDFPFEDSDRGIGHNRYGTSGGDNKDDSRGAQPAVGEYKGRKVAIAYNGNLPDEERHKLQLRLPEELRNNIFDTEDIVNAIVSAKGDDWEERIKNGLNGVDLAYSLTILTDDGRVFGLRGPSGTWPLWYGETENNIIFASETRVYNEDNIQWKEVEPGELIEATVDGVLKKRIFEETVPLTRCALHDTYGAKEDSLMSEGVTYKDFRRELGIELAREHPLDVDIIAGVPNTATVIADGYAEGLGKKATSLIKKNGANKESETRSFIAQNVDKTSEIISKKYKSVDQEMARGKRIAIVEDSLIRGRTMKGDPEKKLKGVIELVREAGAKEIHLLLALSKFVEGCDMGYAIRKGQLVALVRGENGNYIERSAQEIAVEIGADSVNYLSVEGIKRVYERVLGKKEVACMSCMGEEHPLKTILKRKLSSMREKEEVVFSA